MDSILVISSILLWILMALNIIFTLGLARRVNARAQSSAPQIEMLDPGTTLPEFSLLTITGEIVTEEIFKSIKLALLFMSPNCEPCRAKMPELYKYWQKARQADVEVILVSDMGKEETAELVEGHQLENMTVLLAPRDEASFLTDYKAKATPSYYLIDEHGKVRASGIGVPEIGEINNTLN